MLDINYKGKPVDFKTIALLIAIIGGGYTAGANYPQLNPAQLINSTCEASNG